MAWTTPRTWVTGELEDPTILNAHIRDNFNATGVAIVTTAGDIFYATGAGALARLAVGAANKMLQGGSTPSYADLTGFSSGNGVWTLVRATAIDGTPQTIVSGSSASFAYVDGVTVPSSGSNVGFSGAIANGATLELYTGGADSLTLTDTAGALSVARSAGSKTYSISMLVGYFH